MKIILAGLMVLVGTFARADGNPSGSNDLTFTLSEGQSAAIHWHSSEIKSGPHSDNPFTLQIYNTEAGKGHFEDLKGVAPAAGTLPDFFKITMTDMDMPDPADTYQKHRVITRTGLGTYEVSQVYFSMDSMDSNDWQIEIDVNGAKLGSGTVTVR